MNQPEDIADVLHELHVHQAELEVQNHELRESREALEASRARYADLFDFAPIGYMQIDTEGVVTDINLTGAILLGHDRAYILGKPFRSLVQLDAPDAMREHLHLCRDGRQAVCEMGFVRKKDDAHLFMQVVSTAILEHDRRVRAYRTAFIDITERRLAEEQREEALERERTVSRALEQARAAADQARAAAEQATRLKDDFVSVVSHELRTPLNAILGWSHLLSQPTNPAQLAKGLTVIRRNAEIQKRLVDDILDMSRIITGKLRAVLHPMRLEQIVRPSFEAAQLAATTKGVAIDLQIRDNPRVLADAERLAQVVNNLLSNAIKFTPRGGRIDVSVEADGDVARVRVRDTGSGIDASMLPCVFDRFRQGDSSSSRQSGGLGLGLAIVRHITELHGGRATGESAGPGKGSTFIIELPIAHESAGVTVPPPPPVSLVGLEPLSQPEPPLPSLAGVRVLVVDDDEDARYLAALVLEGAGAEVFTAGSAQEALATLARREPSAVVSDLAMPGEDGISLITKVRALGPPLAHLARVPAIAMTAHARAEDARVALAAGFDEYLSKPVEPSTLVAALARLAEHRNAVFAEHLDP